MLACSELFEKEMILLKLLIYRINIFRVQFFLLRVLPSSSCLSLLSFMISSPILKTNSCSYRFFSRKKTVSRSSASSILKVLCLDADLGGELRKLEEDLVENPHDFSLCIIKLFRPNILKSSHWLTNEHTAKSNEPYMDREDSLQSACCI
jgi:hypothetical protein